MQWRFDADIGAFALLEAGEGALVALRTGLFRLDFASGETRLLASPPFDPRHFRFNEGACDDEGRFWVGVMFDPLPGARRGPPRGRFIVSPFVRGWCRAATDPTCITASRSARARRLSSCRTRMIAQSCRAPYDRVRGRMGQARPFAEIDVPGHVPDRAAMDEEGCYWCAIHGGGALHRYAPDGRLLTNLRLSVSQPTMCAFVGPDLDEMVVTSAREKLTSEQLQREPHAGGVFRFRPGVRGLARSCIVR